MNNYDIKRIENDKKKLLDDFGDIPGVEELSDRIIGLLYSDVYGSVYEASVVGENEGLVLEEYGENLLLMPQVKIAAKVLKNPPIYITSLNGVIIAIHFISLMHIIIWACYVFKENKLEDEDVQKAHNVILPRLMTLLDRFDQSLSFVEPDEEYYKKLKNIKWDKKAKKLFKRLSSLKFEVRYAKVKFEKLGSYSSSVGPTEDFALTFLAACSAVNHERIKIEIGDVIAAYGAYLKFLDTDISKMG